MSKKRLDSYDKLADYILSNSSESRDTAQAEADKKLNEILASKDRKWEVKESVSPIDDSKTVALRLKEEGYLAEASLIISKKEGKLNAYVNADKYLGLDRIRVTTRVDKKSPVTRAWLISTDRKAAFHPDPHLLLKVLKEHSKLVVRLTPYGDNTQTYTFNINGLDEVADKLD